MQNFMRWVQGHKNSQNQVVIGKGNQTKTFDISYFTIEILQSYSIVDIYYYDRKQKKRIKFAEFRVEGDTQILKFVAPKRMKLKHLWKLMAREYYIHTKDPIHVVDNRNRLLHSMKGLLKCL